MDSIRKIFGYIHIALALLVAFQFLVSPMYGGDVNGTIWDMVSILMAVGCIPALIFAVIRVRETEDRSDWGAKAMLIATLVLFLLFFRLFFSSQVFDSAEKPPYEFRLLMWYGIDVLFVVVNLFVGRYLLRSGTGQRRA